MARVAQRAEAIASALGKLYEKRLLQDELEVNFFDANGGMRVERAVVLTKLEMAELARELVKAGMLDADIVEVRELGRDDVVRSRQQFGFLEKRVNEILDRKRGVGTKK